MRTTVTTRGFLRDGAFGASKGEPAAKEKGDGFGSFTLSSRVASRSRRAVSPRRCLVRSGPIPIATPADGSSPSSRRESRDEPESRHEPSEPRPSEPRRSEPRPSELRPGSRPAGGSREDWRERRPG